MSDDLKEPVEVGDVLTFPGRTYRYEVISIEQRTNSEQLAVMVTDQGHTRVEYFGDVTKDRKSVGDWSGWVLVKAPKLVTAPVPRTLAGESSEWRAWRDNGMQPGECVCRIPREKCDFHR